MKKITALIFIATIFMAVPTYGGNMAQLKPRDSKTFFQLLNKDTMDLVDQFYAEEMHFKDPVVEFDNREDMKHYYQSSYNASESVTFEVPSVITQGNEQTIVWTMTLKAKGLNKGRPVIVDGVSYIRYNDAGKAVYHRDYFDMGEMIYDHVPFVRRMVKFVDKRMRKLHDPTVK